MNTTLRERIEKLIKSYERGVEPLAQCINEAIELKRYNHAAEMYLAKRAADAIIDDLKEALDA